MANVYAYFLGSAIERSSRELVLQIHAGSGPRSVRMHRSLDRSGDRQDHQLQPPASVCLNEGFKPPHTSSQENCMHDMQGALVSLVSISDISVPLLCRGHPWAEVCSVAVELARPEQTTCRRKRMAWGFGDEETGLRSSCVTWWSRSASCVITQSQLSGGSQAQRLRPQPGACRRSSQPDA